MYSLISEYLSPSLKKLLGILKKPSTELMKLKKKEYQNVDTSVLLRRENKILMGKNTGTKSGAETQGKAIQRLPHLGIHPICSHQTQTPLLMSKKCLLTGA